MRCEFCDQEFSPLSSEDRPWVRDCGIMFHNECFKRAIKGLQRKSKLDKVIGANRFMIIMDPKQSTNTAPREFYTFPQACGVARRLAEKSGNRFYIIELRYEATAPKVFSPVDELTELELSTGE